VVELTIPASMMQAGRLRKRRQFPDKSNESAYTPMASTTRKYKIRNPMTVEFTPAHPRSHHPFPNAGTE